MRRTINLVLALILVLIGAAALGWLTLFAARWRGWEFMAAAGTLIAGAMWLYEDYIDATPNQGRRDSKRP